MELKIAVKSLFSAVQISSELYITISKTFLFMTALGPIGHLFVHVGPKGTSIEKTKINK